MRRTSLAWVLSLLLLLAQHGAVLHELSHLSHGAVTAGASLHPGGHALDGESCPTCHAFSQVTNPVSASPAHLAVSAAAILGAADLDNAIVSANAPVPRSRGPPQV